VEARHRFGALFQGPSGGSEEVTIVAVCRDDTTRAPGHRRLFTLFLASLLTAVAMLALVVAPARAATRRPAEAPITEAGGVALTQPEGLTTDASDNLWVTDTGQSVADEFSPTGGFLLQSTGEAHLTGNSEGAAYSDATDRLLVSDSGQDNVWVLKPDGSFESAITAFPSGATGCCYLRVAVDNTATTTGGDVYVSSVRPSGEEGTVTRLDKEGNPADFSAGPDAGTNALTGPFANAPRIPLAVAPSGDLYVAAGGTVYRFASSGELLDEFSGAGGTPFSEIFSLAVDPTSGNVLLAGGLDAPTIFELSPSGALEARITAANGSAFGRVRGLAVDSAGNLYAADSGTGRVDVFGPAEPLPIESDGGSVSEVTDNAATLRARINPNAHPTTYQFQYGLANCVVPGACLSVPAAPVSLGSGEAFLEPSQRLTGLAPSTTYHFRLLVEDTGTHTLMVGPDRSFTTQPFSAPFSLPDGRQWELVSPADKHGAALGGAGEVGVIEASTGGDAISYLASAPTENASAGYAGAVQVLSRRGAGGWSSRDIASPHPSRPTGTGVTTAPEYNFFAEDLSRAVVAPAGVFEPSLSTESSEATPYLRALGGCLSDCYRPLVTAKPGFANALPGFGEDQLCEEVEGQPAKNHCGPEFQDASPDARHVVLRARPLATGLPSNELYEWSEGQVSLVSVLPGEEPAPTGGGSQPRLGSGFGGGAGGAAAQWAISDDGSRVFWESEETLYVRDTVLGKTLQLDAKEAGCGSCEGGHGRFQLASADGSRVYFTDGRRLTEGSGAGAKEPDLYECRITVSAAGLHCVLTDLTPNENGESANIQGDLLGGALNGSAVYFVADGVLPGTGAARGSCVNSSETRQPAGAHCNLYQLREGQAHLVAVLSGEDAKDWTQTQEHRPTRVSPDGRWLSFLTATSPTGYDNRDTVSGKPVAELYLYGTQGDTLACVSCLPGGGRPTGLEYGQFEVAGARKPLPAIREEWEGFGWIAALPPHTLTHGSGEPAHQPRYLSNSGRLFFNALDPLVPADTNAIGDVYQYEPSGVGGCTVGTATYHPQERGCVDLISSGTSSEAAAFLDASESGDDVFFLSEARLTGANAGDGMNVYDAHLCSTAVPCAAEPVPPSPPCAGEACQPALPAPGEVTPGSESAGPGNTVQCRKGQVRKSGKCVKQKAKKHKKSHKKYANKGKGKKQRRADSRHGGQK
jgi:sugar lactone lactonase YvrE